MQAFKQINMFCLWSTNLSVRSRKRHFFHSSIRLSIWMGRVKLKLKTVESETGRIVTYSKRKNALLKKTNELAVLCEIDVVLLMFSPSGRVALQIGNAVKFDQIIRRFANTSAEERARSNMKVYETLKKSYKNSDHEVQAKYFSGTSSRSVEDLNAQSNLLQNQLAKTQQRLSDWRNPDKIESVELLGQMEDYLKGLFEKIKSQKNQINLPLSAGAEFLSPRCNQNFDIKSAGAELRFPGDGCPSLSPTLIQNFRLESSFKVDSHMHFAGNNYQNIASMSNSNFLSKSPCGELRVSGIDSQNVASTVNPNCLLQSPRGDIQVPGNDSQIIASSPKPNFLLRSPRGELRVAGINCQNIAFTSNSNLLFQSPRGEIRVPGNECQNIASMPRPNFLFQREPQMGTPLTASYLSRQENAVIDSNGDYANNLLQTEILRNELVALRQEARRNEFARSDFLINAYNGAEHITNEGSRNNNEKLNADNSKVQIQQQNPLPQQRSFSLNQQNPLAQQNIVPTQQQDIVSLEQKNIDYSFNEENLGTLSSKHDPVLEWSGSFGALDFALSDSQRPLSVDDYEAEILAQPTDQPKLPDLITISENETGCIDF